MVDISLLQMMMFVCFFFQGSITAAIWMHKKKRFCAQWPQALRRLGMIMSPSIARQLGVLCLALQDLNRGHAWRRGRPRGAVVHSWSIWMGEWMELERER